ncbi:DNA mismatch repair protein MutS [Ruminococcus sp.]|uniref:MutS-related protein n=1 Tax=Ruminococcus sp. TaxID=41978 RepID=UPI0025DDE148|nr:DNA mismatch repair protein MutS [Ruminococcus sp.]MBQ8966354.1 DNA mismatch repair protein MutS [Ruminococcus sp.]
MLWMIAGAIALAIGIIVWQDIKRKKETERYLRNSYGTVRADMASRPDMLGNIEQLYLCEQEEIPEGYRVDDITWDDLGMDTVFALADHTDSFAGEQYMYERLHDLRADKEELSGFEKMARDFDGDAEKRFKVRKKLYSLGKRYIDYDVPVIIKAAGVLRVKNVKLYYVLAVLLVLSIVFAAVIHTAKALLLPVVIYVFNMTVHGIKKEKMDVNIKSMFGLGRLLNTAFALKELIPEHSGDIGGDLEAMRGAAKKAAFLEMRSASDNGDPMSVLITYLLGPFMTDFIMYDRLVAEIEGKSGECMRVYKYVGRLDCAIAAASYRKSLRNCCVPEFTGEDKFSFEGLVHPAIAGAVANDYTHERNGLITGSNASGKSTFIKSAAINLILGQTIHTCTAESAVIPCCGVITSMAVRDDVLSGESYYIREIKYLKRMVELCRGDRLLFLAIDEILKGTNTRERIGASKAILEYFADKKCMLIVATHDLELAKAFEGKYDNYYFSEVIGSEDVKFDYKLHRGISSSCNAIKLLRVIGFPEEIVAGAEKAAAE